MTNVEAYGNRLFGADINATGDVRITNSIFSGNQAYTCSYCGEKKYYGYGLQVISLKNISLDGVTATENNLFGAYLDAAGSVSIANSVFSFNGSDSEIVDGKGLEIKSGGYVSLFNVEASENRLFGANITATKSVAIYQGFFSGNNAYTWSPCEGDQFYGYGLQIVSLDDISLDEVTATYNFLWGANLDAAGNVAISNSVFNFNSTETPIFIDDTGLIVKSGKNVALSNVEANYNRLAGADIYAVGDVSIRNSTFTGNMGYTTNYCNCGTYHGYGLKVVSLGSIALDGVTANDNYLFGAYLDAAADVAIMDSFFNNNGSPSSKNIDGRGLEVKSGGYVSLYKVEANNNREFGANITAAKSVAISSSFFSGNMGYTSSYCGGKTYYGYGLQVVSSDVITLDGVTANDNYLFGANLESAVDINVFNSTFNNNGSPSTKKIEGKGLTVKSGGNVTLNNVQANNNRLFGADIQATGAVTITNSFFSGNQAYTGSYCSKKYYGYGLQVVTLGNIRLENVTANDNNLFGAKLKTEGNVEVVNSFFDSNGTSTSGKNAQGNGLVITGNNVTLENVQANGNRLSGATIEATGSVGITNSNFSFNKYGSGLSVTSGGEITLTKVTATDNGQNGAYLKGNCSNINVIDGTYSNNGEYGLEVVNGMLVISGSPIFADNGAGNIFEDPGTCFITTTAIVPTTTATTSTVASSYIVTPPSHSVNYRFPFRYNNVLSKRYWTFSFGLNHREWLLHYWI